MEPGETRAPITQNDFEPAICHVGRSQIFGDIGQANAVYSGTDDMGHAVEDELSVNPAGRGLAALQVSEGWAGHGIAISGAFAVLTSLPLSAVAGSMDRKTLLLLLTGLMGVSGLIVAVIQLCIALGSSIGGMLFDGSRYQTTFVASAALLAVAAALAFLTSRVRALQAA